MQKPKPPNLVTVSIITTITIVFWVFFTVYRVLTSKPVPEIPENLMEPVNPTLNTQTLNQIPNKKFYNENDIVNPVFVQPSIVPENIIEPETPTPIQIEENVATESAEPTIIP
jgi:hypothetical protein